MNPSHSLKTGFDLFLLECESQRFTAHTLRFYRGRLSLFVQWCEEHDVKDLSQLNQHHIRQYLVDLQNKGVSSAYHHSFARAIKTFLNYCVRDELIPVSPFAKVKMPRLEKKVLSSLSETDIRAILKACKYERDKAIFTLLLDSGLRASELLSLNIEDLDMEDGKLIVQMGKGQKGRTIYIGGGARKQIKRYLIKERQDTQDNEPLFTRQDNNKRIDYDGLKQLIRRIRNQTGLKFSAHTFRRTFAVMSLTNGMDIYILAMILGHADIGILKQYLPLTKDHIKQAHKKYGVFDNL